MIESSVNRKIPCPGPKPYADENADVFFGRENKLSEILSRVRVQRLSVLDAASASGKTSLLQAGLVPAMRESRLAQIAEHDASLSAFPLLVNQWLGRREAGIDYARVFVVEAHRALGASRRWYERLKNGSELVFIEPAQSELRAVDAARSGLRTVAEQHGLATFDVEQDELCSVAMPGSRLSDRDLIRVLVEVLGVLTKAFGSVLLILDQFEEVLGDPLLGRQAVAAVEAIFLLRQDDVRQFLSLRNDALYLLDPLERKAIIEVKRRVSLDRLDPRAVKGIVGQMSARAGVTWGDRLVERLIDTFTLFPGDGSPGRDVYLLGLQVVLRDLFEVAIGADTDRIDLDALRAYAARLSGQEVSVEAMETWLSHPLRDERPDDTTAPLLAIDSLLAHSASRGWIDRCLDPRAADKVCGLEYGLMRPMVARMAESLVTPAGYKRPMTLTELENVAFRHDFVNDRMAGRAALEHWTVEDREKVLCATCAAALERLVTGGVLKERGSPAGTTYELVHDQFGRPLKAWAESTRTGADADVAALHEIVDRVFPWTGNLGQWVHDRELRAAAWVGCTLNNVDFSDLRLVSCHFDRAVFRNCRFPGTVISNCSFDQAMFEGCEFDETTLEDCNLSSVAFVGNCTLRRTTFTACTMDGIDVKCKTDDQDVKRAPLFETVAFHGGSMLSANLNGVALQNCQFEGTSAEAEAILQMQNLQLLDCTLVGSIVFRHCSLDGATLGTKDYKHPVQASDLSFVGCNLAGAELKSLDFTNGKLSLVGGEARGAVLDRLCLPRTTDGSLRGEFVGVILTGAVFLGCELRSVQFCGREDEDRTDVRTESKTLVLRSSEHGADVVPTTLDNVRFIGIQLENATFEGCRIAGQLRFERCDLSGASLTSASDNEARAVEGSLQFDDCTMPALELSLLDLIGEMKLTVVNCIAPGALFDRITLAPSNGCGEAARFEGSDMPGAIFLGCRLHRVTFNGRKDRPVSMQTLVVRSRGELPSSLRDCKFERVRLGNAIFNDTTVEGILSFSNCVIDGGTFGGTDSGEPMRIRGELRFEDDCDCSALEFANLRFEDDAQLRMSGGKLRGGIFDAVVAGGKADRPSLVMNCVELSGALFVGCSLGAMRLTGGLDGDQLVPAWGLVIRGAGSPGHLGDLRVEGYDCDGGSLQSLELDGPVIFKDCSLLRFRISDLSSTGREGAFIDVRQSDLLYAEIDKTLLGNKAPAGEDSVAGVGLLRLGHRQWLAAQALAEWEGDLRLSQRKHRA